MYLMLLVLQFRNNNLLQFDRIAPNKELGMISNLNTNMLQFQVDLCK